MKLHTVAIYSKADTNSLYVQMADEAFYIGPSPSDESYINIEKVIDAVKKSGASYVHPGYGFLSENARFAHELEKLGIKFVGPSRRSIRIMGDKIQSKKIAQAAGVSTIPGHMGVIKNSSEAVKIAKKVGFPVMIKASAGGGGKGMRIVYKKEDVKEAFLSATNEARNSFGDERIFIEKFIERPRHIEIQVIADKYKNVVCLGERECSIQRNNQKVVEEAPSSFMNSETRKKMYKQTTELAKKVGYYSAGTVEYIMDKDRNFYFLEMNTRLQVEHPVTELVTGLDLVELMIKIADGEKLPFTQKDIKLNGWAMESRIYAEDPSRGFLPSSGRISVYKEPKESENVRIDSGVYEGGEVSMFYDAMIAKLCSWGKDRNQAIKHMSKALGDYYIDGVSHNMSFLETIMRNEKFIKGEISTNFIKEEFPEGFSGNELDSIAVSTISAVAIFIFMRNIERNATISGISEERRRQIGERWVVDVDDKKYLTHVDEIEDGYKITANKAEITITSSWQNGDNLFRGKIDGKVITVKIRENDHIGNFLFQYAGSDAFVTVSSPRVAELSVFMPKIEKNAQPTELTAPITGKIVRFRVNEGQKVKPGQDLVIIEAMKMENIITAEHEITVKKLMFKDGDPVGVGQVIMTFE